MSGSEWAFPEVGDLLTNQSSWTPKTVLVITRLGSDAELGGNFGFSYSVLNLSTLRREVISVSWQSSYWTKLE